MKGLIVAAGQGTRLRDIAPSKPLAVVRGVPLIEHVIDAAHAGGVSEFVVVTGYEGARLEAFLRRLAARRDLAIVTVRNPDWRASNGLSVMAAAPYLDERFILMMADHLFDPTLLSDLIATPEKPGAVVLAVDRRLDNPLVDLEDVTRVETDGAGDILRIGKLIEPYDAFDTGVFLASQALIEAIGEDMAAGGAGGISGGMNRLAGRGRAHTFDIGARFWLDVDDAVAHGHAERLSA
ncbi:MAG: NTP transferase domain-containing protein [Caulobacteraceae bacterium]